MKSIPWPDFGKPCQCSTHGPETQICCRVLPVEGHHNRSWRWILGSVNVSRVSCVCALADPAFLRQGVDDGSMEVNHVLVGYW